MKNLIKKGPIFIIEHLESELWEWCLIEYENISSIVGKENLWFTNIKKDAEKLKNYGLVFRESVKDIYLEEGCVLDPSASILLTSKEAHRFKYFIFGGILGDNPPKKRTKIELSSFLQKFKSYNIGRKQFSTDNAVFAVKQILNGKQLTELNFQDRIEIKINNIESTILPYRYFLIDGKPLISNKLIEYLKKH